ncbi:MAG: aliphatic sulfonate ABC transporter substrate-binding protein [Kibdelosporangium sp.]
MRTVLAVLALLFTASACVSGESSGSGGTVELRLDYAYYNPESLVLRDKRWLEDELAGKGVEVSWVLSAGSNKANENLRANTIDVGSTAGAAALLARANGAPIKTFYVFSQPEWAAVVVGRDSPITSIEQLKGRKIAATKGTDPYFFLLQTLRQAGLSGSDVEVVNLQHADGKTALERGDVDAWAGLDPLMAQSQVDAGSRLLHRDIAFNSYGVLNANEQFLKDHPDLVKAVVAGYQRARAWIGDNSGEAVSLLAKESKVSENVAKIVLGERTRLDVSPVPGDAQQQVLQRILPTLVAESQVKSEQDANTALRTLFDPGFASSP